MKGITAFIALAGFAAAAIAQRNAIDIKVRKAGQTEWADSLLLIQAFDGGPPFQVEVAVFYERASGYGFSGSLHNVVVGGDWDNSFDTVTLLDRPDSALHPDGRQGRFNFGAQRQASYAVGFNGVRIAAGNNTQDALDGGVSVKQNTPGASGTLFDTGNPVLGFRFDLTLVLQPNEIINTYDITSPSNRVANFTIYQSETSTSGTNIPLSSVVLDGAMVRTVWFPSPGVTVTLAVGGLPALLRRRRLPISPA